MAGQVLERAAGFIVYKVLDSKVFYLLLKSSKKPFHWTPPKGHLEAGETEMDAAYREAFEEAGLEKHHLRVIDNELSIKYTVNGNPKIVTYWIAELTDLKFDIAVSHEHLEFSWAEFDEARKLVEYNDAQTLLDKCKDIIEADMKSNS